MKNIIGIIILIVVVVGGYYLFTNKQSTEVVIEENKETMSFFITSENPGAGANLGGLAGADAHCQALADAVGAGDHTWQAYLSIAAGEGTETVNARDRIGGGPWHNYDGELIANSVEDLHSNNTINKETGLTENGNQVNGRGDSPNVHDILTGSSANGTLALAEDGTPLTCDNWTSESSEGSAMVGHHDRLGPDTLETATSWNAAHGSRGCSLPDLNGTGGGGLLYCFAKN